MVRDMNSAGAGEIANAQFPEFPPALFAGRTNEQMMAEINSLKPPKFYPPYPSRRNRNATKANVESIAWLHEYKVGTVFEDPKRWEHFLRMKLSEIMTRVYPDADEERVVWLGSYGWWLFLVDDLLDGRGAFRAPERSTPFFVEVNLTMLWSFPDSPVLYNTFVEIVECFPEDQRRGILEDVSAKLVKAREHPGSVYDTSHSGPVLECFKDLWVKLLASTPHESIIRWGNSIQTYLLGNVIEAKNRTHGNIPSIAEYIDIRRNTSSMYPCMWIVDYSENFSVPLPKEIYESAEMKNFQEATNDTVSWHNDIFSVKKELLEGEVHNLVTVVSHERKCSFQEAMWIAVGMLHDRLQDLDRAVLDLEAITPPEHSQMVAGYVKTAHCWFSGSHDFTVVSNERYSWDMSASIHCLLCHNAPPKEAKVISGLFG